MFSVKYKVDRALERHKARLVAKGYTQTHGMAYQETFALIAKMNTICVLLSFATNYDLAFVVVWCKVEKGVYGDATQFI